MDFERRRRKFLIERVENIGCQAENPGKNEIVTGFSCKLPPPRGGGAELFYFLILF